MALLTDEPRSDAAEAEALIKEARRRARRRRARIASVVVVVGGAFIYLLAGGGGDGHAHPAGHDAPRGGAAQASSTHAIARGGLAVLPDIGAFGLVAPGEGWAVNGLSFYFTSDDGADWRMLRVPGLSGGDVIANLYAGASVGANDIFLSYPTGRNYGSCAHPTTPGPNKNTYTIASVARSTDRGRSWELSTLPGCVIATSLSFIDARTGFALAQSTGPPSRSWLVVTRDGGGTWRRVSATPFVGSIEFVTASDGWGLASDTSGLPSATFASALYRTTDGGQNWRRVPICDTRSPSGAAASCGSPRFFGAHVGVLPVNTRNRRNGTWRLRIYQTANGGRTWTNPPITSVPASTRNASASRFVAISPILWIALVATRLYQTSDQGRHWTIFTPKPDFRASSLTQLAFASANDGWLLTNQTSNAPSAPTRFEYTTDGGRTWKPLSKQ